MIRWLLLLALPLVAGCGATTLRVDAAPTIDTDGHLGFESTLALGLGMPIDYSGRSHHYVQALGALGGGVEPHSTAGMFVSGISLDYIYWAEPSMDVRVGTRFTYRSTPGVDDSPSFYGLGAHLGFLPMINGSDSEWILFHLCLGPEVRVERLWSNPAGADRGLFSFPLVAEFNLLAAGD